ncbi:MAG: hypothetical protein K8R50_11220, partial [Betaproteobacteria bacterium]|nr:hypothetical protein [Betaproteobacteria bacterium]
SEITICADKGIPVVYAYPESPSTKAFMAVAERCAKFLGASTEQDGIAPAADVPASVTTPSIVS